MAMTESPDQVDQPEHESADDPCAVCGDPAVNSFNGTRYCREHLEERVSREVRR